MENVDFTHVLYAFLQILGAILGGLEGCLGQLRGQLGTSWGNLGVVLVEPVGYSCPMSPCGNAQIALARPLCSEIACA